MLGRRPRFPLRAAALPQGLAVALSSFQGVHPCRESSFSYLERPRGPGCVTCVRCRVSRGPRRRETAHRHFVRHMALGINPTDPGRRGKRVYTFNFRRNL